MSGELNLETLLNGLTTRRVEGVFVFATVPKGVVPKGLSPQMIFEEAEGTTLILRQNEAENHRIPYEFPSAMLTLNVHSSLDAVGFMAVIATELAKLGMGVNPVAGFFHDHLFVPVDRVDDAVTALDALAAKYG